MQIVPRRARALLADADRALSAPVSEPPSRAANARSKPEPAAHEGTDAAIRPDPGPTRADDGTYAPEPRERGRLLRPFTVDAATFSADPIDASPAYDDPMGDGRRMKRTSSITLRDRRGSVDLTDQIRAKAGR